MNKPAFRERLHAFFSQKLKLNVEPSLLTSVKKQNDAKRRKELLVEFNRKKNDLVEKMKASANKPLVVAVLDRYYDELVWEYREIYNID